MAKQRKPLAQTKTVDWWKCPWCREVNSTLDLRGGNPDPAVEICVECPHCGKEVLVMMSVEYTCQPIEGDESDD